MSSTTGNRDRILADGRVRPIAYRGEAALRKDLDNLKAAPGPRDPASAFIPAVAPQRVGMSFAVHNGETAAIRHRLEVRITLRTRLRIFGVR